MVLRFCFSIGHLSHSHYTLLFSQSQCLKSHFPSAKIGKSQLPFLPLQDPHKYYVPFKLKLQHPPPPPRHLTVHHAQGLKEGGI